MVDDEPGAVVVVEAAPDVVEVVELPLTLVVLVEVFEDVDVVVVVVEAGDVVVVVVEVVFEAGVVVVVCDGGVKMLPLPALPKIDPSGLPEISSMATISRSARTKTMAAVPAMTGHEKRGAPVRPPGTAGCTGDVLARRRSVAGASATAEISRRPVSSDGVADSISTVSAAPPAPAAASVGVEEASTEEAAPPLEPVAPNLRRRGRRRARGRPPA